EVYSASDREAIEQSVAGSADFIFTFPEWSAMNRAMLRAESFMAAALAFPKHPHADDWRKMAEILADDSLGKWEIEDAQIYHAVWLKAYIHYLDLTGQDRVFRSPMMQYYFRYFVSLLTPNRMIPEFGDGRWNLNIRDYCEVLEHGAKEYQSGEMQWAADEIFRNIVRRNYPNGGPDSGRAFDSPDLRFAQLLIERLQNRDPTVETEVPEFSSGDALEGVISKKVVFRSGWEEDAAYLLLNYKDEGYYSVHQKDYLKRTLAVEEEKMHHGHSDENSICLFMQDGTVLLSDGNYREVAPSGKYGAFRADIFHNRVVVRAEKKSPGQPFFEILRNSGAYNDDVRTSKIDFQTFPEIEYSRTRLEDMKNHYRWDRTLLRHRKEDYFIMMDALKFFRSDYYTVVNLLHTRKILDRGENWYLTRIDQLAGEYPNQGDLNLLVIFLRDLDSGLQEEWRDLQEELAVFQGDSRYYDAGLVESFVTVLYPLEPGADPESVVRRFRLIKDDLNGVAVRVDSGTGTDLCGVKLALDLDLLAEDVRPRYNYQSGKLVYGPVETDADMFFLNTSGESPRYSATNLVRFVYEDNVLFDAPESNFFQVWGRSDHVGRAKWRRWGNY
ncbi:MAG TPA: hypothetical protein VKA68_13890, partial [bacterium]|nr:hypothetical protein [bacterium]